MTVRGVILVACAVPKVLVLPVLALSTVVWCAAADVNGNVYKNTGSGWQEHTSGGGWQNAGGDTSWANSEEKARSASDSRFSSFQSSWAGDRGGGGFGGWGSHFGGGGFGGRFGGGGFGGGGFRR